MKIVASQSFETKIKNMVRSDPEKWKKLVIKKITRADVFVFIMNDLIKKELKKLEEEEL